MTHSDVLASADVHDLDVEPLVAVLERGDFRRPLRRLSITGQLGDAEQSTRIGGPAAATRAATAVLVRRLRRAVGANRFVQDALIASERGHAHAARVGAR